MRSGLYHGDQVQLPGLWVPRIAVKLNSIILSKLGENCSSGLFPSSNLGVEQLNFRQLFCVCFLELYSRKQVRWLLVSHYCYCLNYFTFLSLITAKTRDKSEVAFDHGLKLLIRAYLLCLPQINLIGRSSIGLLQLSDI